MEYSNQNLIYVSYFQDILNIYSFLYPDEMEWLPCSSNYRTDHCLSAEYICNMNSSGLILHGSRGVFHEKSITKETFIQHVLPKVMGWYFLKNLKMIGFSIVTR